MCDALFYSDGSRTWVNASYILIANVMHNVENGQRTGEKFDLRNSQAGKYKIDKF